MADEPPSPAPLPSLSLPPPFPRPASCLSVGLDWDPGLDAYLCECFGPEKWERTKRALASPPSSTCLRLASAAEGAAAVARAEARGWEAFSVLDPPRLSRLNVVLVREKEKEREREREREREGSRSGEEGATRASTATTRPPPPPSAVIIVSRVAAEAALRGAPIFAPGVLACTRGVSAGDCVEIRVAIEPRFVDSSGSDFAGGGGAAAPAAGVAARRLSRGPDPGRRRGRLLGGGLQGVPGGRRVEVEEGEGLLCGGGAKGRVGGGARGRVGGGGEREGAEGGNTEGAATTGTRKKKLSNAPSSVRLRAGHGISRGTVFSTAAEAARAAPLLLGAGVARMGRKEMTAAETGSGGDGGGGGGKRRGVAVMLEEPNAEFGWRRAPAEADLLGSKEQQEDGGGGRAGEKGEKEERLRGMAQHLASVVAAAALLLGEGAGDAGARVLDMCAAPGGKTTAIAGLLLSSSSSPPAGSAPSPPPSVLSLDRTAAKAARIASLAEEMGVSGVVTAAVADSLRLFPSETDGPPGAGSSLLVAVDPGAARSEEARLRKEARKAATRAKMGAGRRRKGKGGSGGHTKEEEEEDFPRFSSAAAAAAAEEEEDQQQHGENPPPPPPTRRSLAADPARLVPGSFSHVLLDAPCSGLGLRPRLAQHADRAFVARAAAVQRQLLAVAVAAAGGAGGGAGAGGAGAGENFGAWTGGGRVVYSTCSVSPEENEAVVAAALRRFPRLVLEDARGAAPAGSAGPGLSGEGPSLAAFRDGGGRGGATAAFLPPELAAFVLRFDPASPRGRAPIGGCDTIGFFVAAFSVAPLVPAPLPAPLVAPAAAGEEEGRRDAGAGAGDESERKSRGARSRVGELPRSRSLSSPLDTSVPSLRSSSPPL